MFKYVPVLRYRQQERKALLNTTLSSKTLPMIELVSEKFQTNGRRTTIEILCDDIKDLEQIIVDIPTYIVMQRKTKVPISSYLTPLIADWTRRVEQYGKLPADKVIPTVSYNPNTRVYQAGVMTTLHSALRDKAFSRFAFRVFTNHSIPALKEISPLISKEDILIFDLDDNDHTDPALHTTFSHVQQIKNQTGCSTVIVRSAINNITNSGLSSGQPVLGAVNTLLKKFTSYGFDAYGDFAGTKKDDLLDGGSVSPGVIYYEWSGNVYYGFNSPIKHVREFKRTIVPHLQSSIAWTNYSSNHRTSCFGCVTVENVAQGIQSGDNQPMWKGVSIGHYLYTMEEFL